MVKKSKFGSLRLLASVVCLTASFGIAHADNPVSSFGCSHLEDLAEPKSIEGKDGFFFRVFNDLRLQHTFTDQTVENLALLSSFLKEKGTTLVYVPVPTKSQAMPNYVPDRAKLYGFENDVATFVYKDVVERLQKAGVETVDLQTALRAAKPDEPPFFKADFHWNSNGARLAAQAIAKTIKRLPEYADTEKSQFETSRLEKTISFSSMRNRLQRYCKQTLPKVESYQYQTSKIGDVGNNGALDLFGETSVDPIALIGTSFSDSETNNFDGFIRQYSSLELTNYALTGGNQFGAILSYLTSAEFQKSRPKFLVWENPIYNNLGQYGPAPWFELWAAAADSCGPEIAHLKTENALEAVADMGDVSYERHEAVLIDAGDEDVRAVTVFSTDIAGNQRTISLRRGDRLRSTGRFVVPLYPLGESKIHELRFVFDRASAGEPVVKVCSVKKTGV